MPSLSKNVLIDVRCLQDPYIRHRGIGQHSLSLITDIKDSLEDTEVNIFAFLDTNLPPLGENYATLFRGCCSNLNRISEQIDVFINLSPMTHSPYPLRWILNDVGILKIAVAYDLIPIMQPDTYLSSLITKGAYMACFASLKQYNRIAAISQFASEQIRHALNFSPGNVFVTGCAVRTSLLEHGTTSISDRNSRFNLLIAAGEDVRKNPECALRAHASSKLFQEYEVPAIVTGNYTAIKREFLLKIVEDSGGSPSLVSFANHLEDNELGNLYRKSVLTIVPSFLEGFSLPIIEGAANGSVVLASNSSAHPELISDECCLFDPSDYAQLAGKLEFLYSDVLAWEKMRAVQSILKEKYSTAKVRSRFWEGVF